LPLLGGVLQISSQRRVTLRLIFLILVQASFLAASDLPVAFVRHGDQIDVSIGGKPFTSYYFGLQTPKPYLYPLRSPGGIIVTRGYPMVRSIPGESRDHPHHRSMFFAHGDINGVDFWGEAQFQQQAPVQVQGKTYTSEDLPKGRTVFTKLEEAKGGPDSGTLRAVFSLLSANGLVLGSETQEYVFRGDKDTRIIDCTFTLTADHGAPLKMGDTKEGTFAIRVVRSLEEPAVKMLNSEGAVGEKNIWGKRANWVDYSGVVGGERVGIAIFDNPHNIKHPTYWHARGYGLFAVNPFGEHDFTNDPKRNGSVTIAAGDSLTLRYRVLVHDGDAAEAKVAEAYTRYAEGK
jgi:hypothetical protein